MNNPSNMAYMLIKICGFCGLENKITSAIIIPRAAPPMINIPPSAGFSAVIEYDSIAVIETNPNRVSVLLIVPSSVILSDATPPWKYCGFSAGLPLRYTM